VALLRQNWHILTQRQKVLSFSTESANSGHPEMMAIMLMTEKPRVGGSIPPLAGC